jgi:hypothetical protein
MIYATNIELGHGENGTRMEDDGGLFPGILGTPVPLPTKHHRFEHVRGIPRHSDHNGSELPEASWFLLTVFNTMNSICLRAFLSIGHSESVETSEVLCIPRGGLPSRSPTTLRWCPFQS